MIPIPMLKITQQYARIGFNSEPGQLDIRQPRPELDITTTQPKADIRQPQGELAIDQSKAWNALGVGDNLEWSAQIYSQAKDIALKGIARIVEQGNQMADLRIKKSPIGDIAWENAFRDFKRFDLPAPSYDNVDIHYTPRKPEIEITPGEVHIEVRPHKPEINYTPGKLNFYLEQKNGIQITPPVIDLSM